jgi:hypothetical protein
VSALTNAILSQHPEITGRAVAPARHVVVHGVATRTCDPLWDNREQSAIMKLVAVDELPRTVVRWLALGRRITGVCEHR